MKWTIPLTYLTYARGFVNGCFFGKPFQLERLVVEYYDRNKCDRQMRAQVFMCVIDLNGYCVFQIVCKYKNIFHTFDIYNRSLEGCK